MTDPIAWADLHQVVERFLNAGYSVTLVRRHGILQVATALPTPPAAPQHLYACTMLGKCAADCPMPQEQAAAETPTPPPAEPDPLTCPECGKAAKSPGGLAAHVTKIHSSGQFPCPDCDKVLKTRASLYDHKGRAHPTPSNAVTCGECGVVCGSKGGLTSHQKSHSRPLVVDCPSCPELFASTRQLTAHQRREHPVRTRTPEPEEPAPPEEEAIAPHPTLALRRRPAAASTPLVLWGPPKPQRRVPQHILDEVKWTPPLGPEVCPKCEKRPPSPASVFRSGPSGVCACKSDPILGVANVAVMAWMEQVDRLHWGVKVDEDGIQTAYRLAKRTQELLDRSGNPGRYLGPAWNKMLEQWSEAAP